MCIAKRAQCIQLKRESYCRLFVFSVSWTSEIFKHVIFLKRFVWFYEYRLHTKMRISYFCFTLFIKCTKQNLNAQINDNSWQYFFLLLISNDVISEITML